MGLWRNSGNILLVCAISAPKPKQMLVIVQVTNDKMLISKLQKIDRAMPNNVTGNKDPASLQLVSKVYGEEADRRREAGQSNQGYELIRDVASFKARVQALAAKRYEKVVERQRAKKFAPFLFSARFWNKDDFEIFNSSKNGFRLAVNKKECKARYIVSL